MMKKFIVVAAVVAALGMTACSSSSSSTSTTSTTVNGITTTTEVTTITENGKTRTETVKTVTDENGNVLSVTDGDGNPIGGETAAAGTETAAETEAEAETMTEAETEAVAEAEVDENDPTGLRARWHEMFFDGAEGENENGDHFYFACDDYENVASATVMILNKDMTELDTYLLGDVDWEDDAMVIYDVDGEHRLPVILGDGEEEGTFTMAFKDGDVATMHYVDQDTIINDMVSVVENLNV